MASTHKLITMSHLKTIVIVVVVLVIASSAVFVVSEGNFFHRIPSPVSPSPHASFLPSSTLNSTYGIGFVAVNYTANASGSFSYMDKYNLVGSYMWIYGNNSSTLSFTGIASLIMVFNSSSDVTAAIIFSNLTERVAPNSTVVSTGNFSGFLYSVLRLNASTPAEYVIIAHDGKFILLMAFIGTTWDKGMSVFQDQVRAMLSSAPSAPAAFWVS